LVRGRKWKQILTNRTAPARGWIRLLLATGVITAGIVQIASLRAPLALDDYAQRAMIEGRLTPRSGSQSGWTGYARPFRF
jgi:hypothetical protein